MVSKIQTKQTKLTQYYMPIISHLNWGEKVQAYRGADGGKSVFLPQTLIPLPGGNCCDQFWGALPWTAYTYTTPFLSIQMVAHYNAVFTLLSLLIMYLGNYSSLVCTQLPHCECLGSVPCIYFSVNTSIAVSWKWIPGSQMAHLKLMNLSNCSKKGL